jgi:glutamate mutase epsilon subunit
MTDLAQETLLAAEQLVNSVEGGPGYYGRLYVRIAADRLRAKAEEADRFAVYFPIMTLRAAELRAVADELEGK